MNFLGTFVMRSCNAPFPQGLHRRGGRGGGLGTPGGTCKSATYHHQPQESPPPPPSPPPKGPLHSPHKQNLHWRSLFPIFCSHLASALWGFFLSLSLPLSLWISLFKLRTCTYDHKISYVFMGSLNICSLYTP